MKEKLLSRKLIALVLTSVFVAVNEKAGLGLSNDVVMQIVGLACAYFVGQGIADAGKEKAKAAASDTKKDLVE